MLELSGWVCFTIGVCLQDVIQGALIIAVLYLIFNTYSQIENIK